MRNAALVFVLLLLACGGPSPAPEAPPHAWTAAVAFEAGGKLGGCAVGDLDPASPGNEIAAVAADGRILLVRRAAGAWAGEAIARVPGEMIQCAIGDADPTRGGEELVAVGMAEGDEDSGGKGAVWLVRRAGDSWERESVLENDALVHGVAIADVDPDHPGNEVVAVGFGRHVTVLGRTADGWRTIARVPADAPAKTAVAFRGGVAVANTGSAVWLLEGERVAVAPQPRGAGPDEPPLPLRVEMRWKRTLLGAGAPQARIATDGTRLLAACDDGTLRLGPDEGAWPVVFREGQKLRGAVLADLDPSVPGLEAATAGYARALTLLHPPAGAGGAWRPTTLWTDTDRFHHVAAGEVMAEGVGLEIVAVGYSGRVVIAACVAP